MKRMRWIPAVVLLAACAPAAAVSTNEVGSPGQTAGMTVEDRDWRLVELNGAAVAASAHSPTLRLASDGARAAGTGGCNRWFGGYQLSGGRLGFGAVGSTRMACLDDGVMQTEQQFFAALQSVTRYGVADDVLTLYAADQPVARFRPGTPAS